MSVTTKNLRRTLQAINWWTPPRLWEDETCYIIGGGPSLEGFDFFPIHKAHVIGCNDAYMLGPWVDICIFGDWGWWIIHGVPRVVNETKGRDHNGLLRFPGLIVANTPPKNMIKQVRQAPRIRPMRRRGRGLGADPGTLCWYDNVGASAIHLAILLGCSRIILLGFDMTRAAGKQNWHRAIKTEPPVARNKHHAAMHIQLAKEVSRLYPDVEVLNANPESACEAWPKVTWDEVKP